MGLQTSLVDMAKGQIIQDIVNRARKNFPAKAESDAPLNDPDDPDDPFSKGSTDEDRRVFAVAKLRAEEKSKTRLGIASGLKDLSKRGALTGDLLKEARQRATGAGVTDEQFSSFMDKEDIKTQNSATESKEEAAQNVMFQNQYGTGLGALAAMQDPNYELGSGSPLNQPARAIGPASGKFRSASRRLRRQGYGAAAQQMAMMGEMTRMGEPSIDTPALRGQRMLQKMATAKEAQKQDKIASGSKDVMGMKKPKSNVSIQEPMAKPNESTLEKTLNKGGLGVTNKGFGPVKRQGQHI